MKLFLISVIIFALAIVGMAIGVIVGNRRLRGSCGGLAGREDDDGRTACDLCTVPSKDCDGERGEVESRMSRAENKLANERR